METNVEDELLKRYLLGVLDPDERQQVEERLMLSSGFLQELERTECELIDDYLSENLSQSEKEKFESFFLLAPERQRKLRFSKALRRYVASHPVSQQLPDPWWARFLNFWRLQNPVLSWSLAAALVLLIAGGTLSMLEISRLRQTLQTETRNAQKLLAEVENRNSELIASLQREQTRHAGPEKPTGGTKKEGVPGLASLLPGQTKPTLFALALTPGLLRDIGGSRKASIPPGTNLVQLDLSLASVDHARYRAVLQRVGEGEIWTQISPKPASLDGLLHIVIPAALLTPGDYVAKLSGIGENGETEDVGSYYFRLTRNQNRGQ
jgi:anti-sigma-K factor RskA